MTPDYALLGQLARKPASGYDLGKWLETDGIFMGRSASMTPIYRALGHLHDLGWITYREEPREGAPVAKVYSLTDAGRQALVAWARSEYEPAPRPMSPDFIVRLNFAGQLGPDVALRIVETELAYRRRQRAAETFGVLATDGGASIPEIDPAWLARIDYLAHARGWQSTSLYIGWLETTAEELRAALPAGSAAS
ncbi:MAG: PadR family transcriptional regulator [Dermabacter sp.]|nr:PadR family transcriptional regulator [Dermabacter sp.]